MGDWLLYCLNETGRVVSTERVAPVPKPELRRLAKARLAACHAVEVWDGAICILRIHSDPAPPA